MTYNQYDNVINRLSFVTKNLLREITYNEPILQYNVCSGTGTAYTSEAPKFIPIFRVGFVLSRFQNVQSVSFLFSTLSTIICPFVPFLLLIVCHSNYGL